MATKGKSKGKSTKGHGGGHHKGKGKGKHGKRRRNPGAGSFGTRLGRLAGMGLLAVGTGVGVYWVQGMVQDTHPNFAMYGVPAIGLGVGALAASKYPMVGVGIGVGAVAPLAIPVAAKVLSPSSAKSTAGVALGRAVRQLRAVQSGMGSVSERYAMGMGAVQT